MNDRDPYQSWLKKRWVGDVSADFTAGVMARIAHHEESRRSAKPVRETLERWLEWVSGRPLLQAALLSVGLLGGVLRLLATLRIILAF